MAVAKQSLQTDLAAVQAALATLTTDLSALPAPAAAATTVLTSVTGSLTDGAGRVWTLVAAADQGLQLAIGGKPDTTTSNVVLAVLDANGALRQKNNKGGWWVYTGSGCWADSTDRRSVAAAAPSTVPATPAALPAGPGPKASGSFVNVDCSAAKGSTLRPTLFGSSMASDIDFTPHGKAAIQQAAKVAAGFGMPGMYVRINTNDSSMDGSGNPNLDFVDRVSAAMPKIIDPATGSFSYNLGGRGASASQFAAGAAQTAKRFIANGVPCKGFEVFNENDGLDLATYVAILNATADALHAVDPGIEVIGTNDSWMHGDRMAALGNQSAGKIARYHYHSYSVDSTFSDPDAFSRALDRFGCDARALRAAVAKTAGASLPAGVGEYNMCGNPPGDLRQTTHKGAVFNALGLWAAFDADPLTTHGAYWDWLGDGYYGIVVDPDNNPAKLAPLSVTPAGYMLKNCRQCMAGSVVGVAAPFSNVKALATVNGSRVSLWIINYNTTADYSGQVAFSNWPVNGTGNGTATVLEVSAANPASKTYSASVSGGLMSSITVPAMSSVVVTAG